MIVIKDIIGREGKGAIFFKKNIKNAQKYTKIRDFFFTVFEKDTLMRITMAYMKGLQYAPESILVFPNLNS